MSTDDITASRARSLLERHDLHARRRLGQHFLVDPNTVRKIVRLAAIRPDETILEVGPGLGSLTVALSRAASRVVAVELDEAVSRVLAEVASDLTNVEVVIADAARADLDGIVGGPSRLVANLPYNAATPILAHVLEDARCVAGGLVMVQRELGERWTSGPGSRVYGAISVKVAFHATARIVADVPRTVFLPPPKVASVLVAFERRPAPVEVDDSRRFLRFVESAFAHRRKTILNSLATAGLDRVHVEAALARAAMDASARPEQLGLAELARLYRTLRAAA